MSIEQTTGTSDPTYDLVSVLYHALHGVETYDHYVSDAEERGDRELADFFREVQDRNREIAERAKELLRRHLS